MTKSNYTENEWLIVQNSSSKGITRTFKQKNLKQVILFSEHAMAIVKNAQLTDSAMVFLNGFECIISIRLETPHDMSEEMKAADRMNEISLS